MNEVVMEWESVVVCGRAAMWWDEQIKDNARREVYRKVVNG